MFGTPCRSATFADEWLRLLELTTAAVDRGEVAASDVKRACLDGAVHALRDVLDEPVKKLLP